MFVAKFIQIFQSSTSIISTAIIQKNIWYNLPSKHSSELQRIHLQQQILKAFTVLYNLCETSQQDTEKSNWRNYKANHPSKPSFNHFNPHHYNLTLSYSHNFIHSDLPMFTSAAFHLYPTGYPGLCKQHILLTSTSGSISSYSTDRMSSVSVRFITINEPLHGQLCNYVVHSTTAVQ